MPEIKGEKKFKDYEVLLKWDEEHGDRMWMKVQYNGKGYPSESWFVNPPNWFQRVLFKVTWQDKIKDMEQKLFKKLLAKIQEKDHPEIRKEIEKWVKGAENV